MLFAVAFAITMVSPAAAHALIKETNPRADQVVSESPNQVVMEFTEPVEISFGAVRVFDTNGERVDVGQTDYVPGADDAIAAPLQPDLADGTYTVTWRVVSIDGHPIQEAFVFHVGAPGDKPGGIAGDVLASGSGDLNGFLLGVTRWLNFASLLALSGATIFLAVVWRHPRGRPDLRDATAEQDFFARWRAITAASASVAAVATLLSLPLQAAVAGGLGLGDVFSTGVLMDVLDTRFGITAVMRLGFLALLVVLWLGSRRIVRTSPAASLGAAGYRPNSPRWLMLGAAVIVTGLLATFGLSGHAGATPPTVVNVAIDTVHLVGVSAWVGGLIVLLFAAIPACRAQQDERQGIALAPVVSRFSDLAAASLAVIVASGLYSSWLQVRHLSALTGEPYGVALLIKLGVIVPLLVLGAVNNRWTKSRIQRVAEDGKARRAPVKTLRRLVLAEVALAGVVLAITSVLVNLPPARLQAGATGPFIADTRIGPYNLNVLVDPGKVGENIMHLTATTAEGTPARVLDMRVLLRMPSRDIGPIVAEGRKLAKGHFAVQGRQLSVPGDWMLKVVARTQRFREERTTVEISVNP